MKKKIKKGIETNKIKIFLVEYMKDKNATRAAIAAGYSKKTAYSQGSRLLKNVEVRKKINEQIKKQQERLQMTADDVLRELTYIAKFDIRKAYDEEGKLLPIQDMPEEIAKVISMIESEELYSGIGPDREHIGDMKRLKIFDKLKALELIGRHFKLYTDKVEHSVSEDLAVKLSEARKRAGL